jgi:hypothetical protein
MEWSGSSCSTARATVMPPMPESKMPIMGKDFVSVQKVKKVRAIFKKTMFYTRIMKKRQR